MIIAMNLPQLYPTPLIEGLLGSQIPTNVPPDENFSGSLTMFPTPLLNGFARQADRTFSGALGLHPTPLVSGFERRVLDPMFSGSLTSYPTPQISGFYTNLTRTTSYDGSDTGVNNTSDTVFVDQKTHTVSGSVLANKTWLVMGFAAGNMGFSGQPMSTRFRNNTAGVDFGGFVGEIGDSASNAPWSCMGVVTFGASPGDQTFSIGAKSGLGGIGAKTVYNRIMLIELTSDDAYSYTAAALNTSTSNSTWTTMASVNVPAAGDYDIFAFAVMSEGTSQGNDCDFELLDSAGSRDKYVLAPALVSTTKRNPLHFHSERLSMNAGDSALLRAKPNSGVTAKTYEYRCVVALNRNRWSAVGYSNDPTSRTNPPSTYTERNALSTKTVTFNGTSEYILWGNATQCNQTDSVTPFLRLVEGSNVLGEGSKQGGNIAGGDRPFVLFKKYTPAAGASSVSWQNKQASSTANATYKFADAGYWKI